MKTLHKIIILISITLFSISCEKDNDEIAQTDNNVGKSAKHLCLDNVKRAYYNSASNRYETNNFTLNSNSFDYSITVESGKKYRVLLYGLYMENVKMDLLDKSDALIKSGEQANVGNTAKYMIYESLINDTLFINISSDSTFNKPFFLSFEEINTYQINWKGHDWDCDGDWEVNSQDQLVFKGYKSGFSKWIKLKDSVVTDYRCDVSFNVVNGKLNNFLGLAVNSSDIIHDMTNLPEVSTQFKVNNINNWELWKITLGTGGGIGREIGDLVNNLNTTNNVISSKVDNGSASFFVNNELAIQTNSGSMNNNLFYLTTEDFGNDSIIISDIKFHAI